MVTTRGTWPGTYWHALRADVAALAAAFGAFDAQCVERALDITEDKISPGRHQRPQSSSSSRRTASHAGFLLLSQSGERPERYIDVFRFETMPSRPILQAWANTVGPSASMCSLNRRPGAARLNTDANVAFLVSSGSRRRSSPFNSIRSKAYRNTLASCLR